MSKPYVIGLFKFGERAHIEKFLRDGHLYMNTVSYFAGSEANTLRADRFEGSSFCIQSATAKLSVKIDGEFKELPGLIGPIGFREDATGNNNLFCMHALYVRHGSFIVDPRNFGFGDTYACLMNPDAFLRRVERAAQDQGKELKWGLVEYVDKDTYSGPMGPFRKFSTFSYQTEFRIILSPGDGAPYSLRIGDLSDIVAIGDVAQIDDHFEIATPPDAGPA